jgi:hypothetical protein
MVAGSGGEFCKFGAVANWATADNGAADRRAYKMHLGKENTKTDLCEQ